MLKNSLSRIDTRCCTYVSGNMFLTINHQNDSLGTTILRFVHPGLTFCYQRTLTSSDLKLVSVGGQATLFALSGFLSSSSLIIQTLG